MDINKTIKEIKGQFRLFMNGAISQSMREKGIEYKLNFGIEFSRLKEIASSYEKNHTLAQALWKEEIRECKILATFLQPTETFLPEIADIWVESIKQQEIAEIACMNLFQHLPYAAPRAFQWIADDKELVQVCGFMTLARLFMNGALLGERAEDEFLDQAIACICNQANCHKTAYAAFTSLRTYATNARQEKKILKSIETLAQSENENIKLYHDLLTEVISFQ